MLSATAAHDEKFHANLLYFSVIARSAKRDVAIPQFKEIATPLRPQARAERNRPKGGS